MNPTCDVCKCLTHAPILRGNQLICANCLNIPAVAKPVFIPETAVIETVGSLIPSVESHTIHDDETPSTIPLATFEKSDEITPIETPSKNKEVESSKEVEPLPEPPKGKKSFFSKKGR